MTFISYDEELKEIWRDNIAFTKSRVLEYIDDNSAYTDTDEFINSAEFQTAKKLLIQKLRRSKRRSIESKNIVIGLNTRGSLQFITKIPEWNNNNSSGSGSKRRNNIGGP
jgi:hypothetical protein